MDKLVPFSELEVKELEVESVLVVYEVVGLILVESMPEEVMLIRDGLVEAPRVVESVLDDIILKEDELVEVRIVVFKNGAVSKNYY